MGRRPGIQQAGPAAAALGGFSPEVRKKVDDVMLMYLDALELKLKARLETDDLKDFSLKELMKEFRELVKAGKAPASSITAIQLPSTPQRSVEHDPRENAIDAAADDPAQMEKLRESQKRFLEREQSGS